MSTWLTLRIESNKDTAFTIIGLRAFKASDVNMNKSLPSKRRFRWLLCHHSGTFCRQTILTFFSKFRYLADQYGICLTLATFAVQTFVVLCTFLSSETYCSERVRAVSGRLNLCSTKFECNTEERLKFEQLVVSGCCLRGWQTDKPPPMSMGLAAFQTNCEPHCGHEG